MLSAEDCTMILYAVISVVSMLVGYALSISSIMKQCDINTELRVQILETLNRERKLIDEYREFVLETKTVNSQLQKLLDSLTK
jgi:hypothetical protein